MTSLLNSFTQPDLIGKFSQAAGVDAALAQKGIDVIAPLVLGSLAQKSQTVSGMDSIMRMLPEESGGLLGQLFGSGQKSPLATASMLTGVLGPGVSSIGKLLNGRLGFNVTPLLATAAPLVLGTISKVAKENKFNSGDIGRLLQEEQKSTMAAARPEVQAVLNEAFKLGDKAEKLRASFTDEEWNRIRLAPSAVTMYVVSASPSGAVGLTKELRAAGEALQTIVKDALPTSLVDVAYGSFEGALELDKELGIDEAAPRASMLTLLRVAAGNVRTKSQADASSFSQTLVALARKVAEASKEGGFLGIGGTKVSAEEERAIGEIASAVA